MFRRVYRDISKEFGFCPEFHANSRRNPIWSLNSSLDVKICQPGIPSPLNRFAIFAGEKSA